MSRLEQLKKDKEELLHIKTLPFDLKDEIKSYYEREISSEELKIIIRNKKEVND